MEQQAVKEVPYGVSDFARVMTQNMYYVDKTMYLPELEKQPSNLFFIRPRCFGKSKSYHHRNSWLYGNTKHPE